MKTCLDCGAEIVYKPHQGDGRHGTRLRCAKCSRLHRLQKANVRAKAAYRRKKEQAA